MKSSKVKWSRVVVHTEYEWTDRIEKWSLDRIGLDLKR